MGKEIRKWWDMITGSFTGISGIIAFIWEIGSKGAIFIDYSKIDFGAKFVFVLGIVMAIGFWIWALIYALSLSKKGLNAKETKEKRSYLVSKIGLSWNLAGNIYRVIQNYDTENPLQMMSVSCNPICPICNQPLALSNGSYICVSESCVLLNKKCAILLRDDEIRGRFNANVCDILVEFERKGRLTDVSR